MASDSKLTRFVLAFGIAAVTLSILTFHAVYYLPFISDDACISLRYSKRLLQGRGLTWNDGEYVEGYSNLLWVLGAAFFGFLGLDLIHAVRIMGYFGVAASILAVIYRYMPSKLSDTPPALFGALTIALSGSVAVWTFGGLESGLVAGLLAWATVLSYPLLTREYVSVKHAQLPGLFFALLCITRSDGFLFTASAVLAILLVKGLRRRTFVMVAGLILLPALFCLIQHAFRLAYYGELLPNTAVLKAFLSERHFIHGLSYMKKGVLAHSYLLALMVIPAIVCFKDNDARKILTLLVVSSLLWACHVIVIGGDNLTFFRHFIPLIVFMGLLLAEGCETVKKKFNRKNFLLFCTAAIMLLSLFGYTQLKNSVEYHTIEGWQADFDAKFAGLALKKAFSEENPLIALTAAGCLPYWSELPSLDMLGLTDYHLAHHLPKDLGYYSVGHELGDGEYVLGRQPDIIIFCSPTGRTKACYRSGREMQANPLFQEKYSLSTLQFSGLKPLTAYYWIRKDSPKIGVKKSDMHVIYPAILLNGNPNTLTRFDKKATPYVKAAVDEPVVLRKLTPPFDRFLIEARPGQETVRIIVRRSDTDNTIAEGESPLQFNSNESVDAIDVILRGHAAEGAIVHELVFTRIL